MQNSEIKKLVILGGGTAGCIAAAALARQLNPEQYQITVVESSHIGSIGVGESVLPSFISFVRWLGLDEQDFIQKTDASIKLGIQFRDWLGQSDGFFQPLGTMQVGMDGHDFFSCWLKARAGGDPTPLQDYIPSALMASQQRFALPSGFPPGSPLKDADYSIHLDASLVCRYLREFARQRKVRYINAHVVRVNSSASGSIKSLELNNRESIDGDFFIDCTGLRSLLIGEVLSSGFESWKHFLPCDRAVIVQTPETGAMPPYTVNMTRESGWVWRIPLQRRMSSGYVFSSEYSSDNRARQVLLDSLEAKPLQEPHFVPFHNGMRNQLWKKNCIALGLAGGFLEPMESTAIHLIIRGVENMLELFPNLDGETHEWPALAAEYNRRLRIDFEEIRDFIVLHYCTSKRADTEFWRRCQSRPVPDRLATRIELFKMRAELPVADDRLFKKTNWLAVLTGMGVIPRAWHPFIDMADFTAIHQAMQAQQASLVNAVQQLPVYDKFLNDSWGKA